MMNKSYFMTICLFIYLVNGRYLDNVDNDNTYTTNDPSIVTPTTNFPKVPFDLLDKKKFFPSYQNKTEWDFDFFKIINNNPNTYPECKSVEIIDPPHHTAGYIDIIDESGSVYGKMFYMYFENRYRIPEVPLLLWCNGGPGSSSISGAFNGRGPYSLQEDDSTLCWSKYGWDIHHNLLFVDYPMNVGFSYTNYNLTDYDSKTAPEFMLQFLYKFYEIHPELIDNDFYLTGVSHAGRYLPNIADTIMKANDENKGTYINLKGLALASPAIDPVTYFTSKPIYALAYNLISEDTAVQLLVNQWPICNRTLNVDCDIFGDNFDERSCLIGLLTNCDEIENVIKDEYKNTTGRDLKPRDIINICSDIEICASRGNIAKFLNQEEVKEILGTKEDIDWESSDDGITLVLYWERALDTFPWIMDVFERGHGVLIYSGDYDLRVTSIGIEMLLNNTDWKYNEEWLKEEKKDWIVDGVVAGKEKSVKNLKFVDVKDAGHSPDVYQPKNILSLILKLTYGEEMGTYLFNKRPYY